MQDRTSKMCPFRKLLMTGVAALFLATGTAHADNINQVDDVWKCGNVTVTFKHLGSDMFSCTLSGKLPRHRVNYFSSVIMIET